MIIKIYDDKKYKPFSFEARVSLDLNSFSYASGDSSEEAVQNLEYKICNLIIELQKLLSEKTIVNSNSEAEFWESK